MIAALPVLKTVLVLVGIPAVGLIIVAAFITRDVRRHRKNLRDLAKKENGKDAAK
jgi:hypothetical protein